MAEQGRQHEDLVALLRARGLSEELVSQSLYSELAEDMLDFLHIRVEAALPRRTEQEQFIAAVVVVRTLLTIMEAQCGSH